MRDDFKTDISYPPTQPLSLKQFIFSTFPTPHALSYDVVYVHLLCTIQELIYTRSVKLPLKAQVVLRMRTGGNIPHIS